MPTTGKYRIYLKVLYLLKKLTIGTNKYGIYLKIPDLLEIPYLLTNAETFPIGIRN